MDTDSQGAGFVSQTLVSCEVFQCITFALALFHENPSSLLSHIGIDRHSIDPSAKMASYFCNPLLDSVHAL